MNETVAIWAEKLADFAILAVRQCGPLVLWVLILSTFYAGLERVFPRLGGPPASRPD
jgi:hypothetical protein